MYAYIWINRYNFIHKFFFNFVLVVGNEIVLSADCL